MTRRIRINRFELVTSVLVFAFGSLECRAQVPQINSGGVVNAASYAPGAPLTPGVIFSIFGSSLTDGSSATASSTPLPPSLAGATVLVSGVPAPLFYASPLQINAQFPVELKGLASAIVQVQVQRAGSTLSSLETTVSIASFSPGIFTVDQNGQGPGTILRNSDFNPICPQGRTDCPANFAAPEEVIAIYLTGLGEVDGTRLSGRPATEASPTLTLPEVTIGGIRAHVLYAGLAPNYVGLYQVNVFVPTDSSRGGGNISLGDDVPMVLRMGESTSNTVTIAVGKVIPSGPVTPQRGNPLGGAVVGTVEIDPRNSQTLYAGTNRGIFRSADGGASWNAVNNGLPASVSFVNSLGIDPSNPDTIYAATSGGGIFKSADAGGTWAAINTGLTSSYVFALAIDPSEPTTVYAAVNGGIYKSTNGGEDWSPFNTGLTNTLARGIVIDPANPATLYALASSVFKSTNRGENWTAIDELEAAGINTLVIDPLDHATIYAAGCCVAAIYKSSDSGESWTQINSGVETRYFNSLAIDPSKPETLYAATDLGIFKTDNGGTSWTLANFPTLQILDLKVPPSDPATVYAAGTGGVFQSTDNGQEWTGINFLLSVSQVFGLELDPSNPFTIFAGTEKGIFKSTNGGADWIVANSGLTTAETRSIAVDPSNPFIVYAGTNGGGLFRSVDGGQAWSPVNSALTAEQILALAIDPSSFPAVFAGTAGNGAFKSTDGGNSWTPSSSGLPDPGTSVQAIAISSSNPTTLYVGTLLDSFRNPAVTRAGGVFKSTDGGGTWTAINSGLVDGVVYTVTIDPLNPATLYAGTTHGLYKTTDGGGNWMATGLTDTFVQNLTIDPSSPSTLYVGTLVTGVFKTTDGGVTWASINSGFPDSEMSVGALVIDPSNPATVYAGTTGFGVFKTTDGGQNWQPAGGN